MRAQPLGLRPGDRESLESWTRSSSIKAGLAQRARELERMLDLALDAEPLARAAGSN